VVFDMNQANKQVKKLFLKPI